MFHSVSLLSQAPLARGSRALPSVLLKEVSESALTPSLSVLLHAQDGRIEVKKAAGNLSLINGVRNRIHVK